MKTQYYRNPNSYSRAGFSPSRALVIFILVAIVSFLLLLRAFAPGFLISVASPLWKGGSRLSASVSTALNLESKAELISTRDAEVAKNQALIGENAVLTTRVSDLEKLLGQRSAVKGELVASVLAHPPVSPYDTLVLDKGTLDGVTVDAHVYGPGGIPAGKISEASTHSSRATLYSSSGTKSVGWAGAGRVPLTLIGVGAGAFEASVSKDAGLATLDGVYIGAGGAAPIGTIISIEEDPSSPSVVLHIRPFINPFSLTFVTIGSSYE